MSAVHAAVSVLWLLYLKSDFNKNVYRQNVSPIYHVVFLLIGDMSLGTEFENDCSTQKLLFACVFDIFIWLRGTSGRCFFGN